MGESKIEWTDATWNPARGCTRVSEGCRNCYAERQAARNLPGMRSPTTGEPFAAITEHGPRWTGAVELIPEKLAEPLRWKKPRRVFVNSMSDLFHEALPAEAIAEAFAVMLDADRHTFQVLTKRPERAVALLNDRHFGALVRLAWGRLVSGEIPRDLVEVAAAQTPPWPLPNVWLGTSVEEQATADARIPYLLRCPAAVRFVSYEPALGRVDFERFLWGCAGDTAGYFDRDGRLRSAGIGGQTMSSRPLNALHWLICGGESGPGARPFHLAWARSTREQCAAAGCAFFFKQAGAKPVAVTREDMTEGQFVDYDANGWDEYVGPVVLRYRDRKGGDPREWPEDLRVREFPEMARG